MKHDIEPNTAAWMELRSKFRTASEAAIVLGISPFTSPERFKLIKAGLAKQYYSSAMAAGHAAEDRIRGFADAFFQKKFAEEVHTRGSYLASLDGICGDHITEFKTSTRTYTDIKEGRIPEYYAVQIQQQLYCAEARVAHLIAFCPKTEQFAVSEAIYPDIGVMTAIEAAWANFDAMPIPEGPIDADDNLDLFRAFETYAATKREIERLEELLATQRDTILAFKAPDRKVTCRGFEIISKAGASKVDYKKAATDAKLDLAPYKTVGEPTYTLKMAAPAFLPDDSDE